MLAEALLSEPVDGGPGCSLYMVDALESPQADGR